MQGGTGEGWCVERRSERKEVENEEEREAERMERNYFLKGLGTLYGEMPSLVVPYVCEWGLMVGPWGDPWTWLLEDQSPGAGDRGRGVAAHCPHSCLACPAYWSGKPGAEMR